MADSVKYKPLVYPAKILLAWGEAIVGNNEIRDWLAKNGYPELYTFVFALNLKQDARDWLMKNKYPHLIALIQGVERNKNALAWLKNNKFEVLYHMALAGDGETSSLIWLKNNQRDFAHLALKIKERKDQIQLDHDDVHRMSTE
jgi:P2-related tail formation protein